MAMVVLAEMAVSRLEEAAAVVRAVVPVFQAAMEAMAEMGASLSSPFSKL